MHFDAGYHQAVYEALWEHINRIPIMDTHEHLPLREECRDQQSDVLQEYLCHYFSSDLVSAGLSQDVLDKQIRMGKLTVTEKWKLIEAYWDRARFTGYGQAIAMTARDLYGVEHIDGNTISLLNDRFLAARATGNCYNRILKDKCHIEKSMIIEWCNTRDHDCSFFQIAANIDMFVEWSRPENRVKLEEILKKPLTTFEDLLEDTEQTLKTTAFQITRVFKLGCAYSRGLAFSAQSDYSVAKQDFDRMMAIVRHGGAPASTSAFEDYMVNHVLRVIERFGGVVQVHTGLLEPSAVYTPAGNDVRRSNPELLTDLILAHPHVTFDLFHMGYPYQNELAAMAKSYPNVTVDLCWAHSISPSTARRVLDEYLDAIPHGKISAFGGDSCFVDAVYGHLLLAKQNVACVLTEKVCMGQITETQASDLAYMLLYRTPKTLLFEN